MSQLLTSVLRPSEATVFSPMTGVVNLINRVRPKWRAAMPTRYTETAVNQGSRKQTAQGTKPKYTNRRRIIKHIQALVAFEYFRGEKRNAHRLLLLDDRPPRLKRKKRPPAFDLPAQENEEIFSL